MSAEDTDIFSGASANGAVPNILILVDNTSSNNADWANACPFPALQGPKLLDMVYCSLYGTLELIKTNGLAGKFNVGLMVGGSGSNKGGEMYYPNSSPYNLPLMDATGLAAFQTAIAAGVPFATGNAKLDGDMTEVWAWLTGNTGPRSGTSYTKHIGTLSCQKSFLIVIGAAAKQGRPCVGSGCGSASELASAGATTAQQVAINTGDLGPNTGDAATSWVDEWSRFLYQTDFNNNSDDKQGLITYTIAAGGTDADYTQHLKSTAIYGGGKPFVGGDYDSMKQAFLNIFNEVAAVNSVFASVSLPISTTTQGTFDDKIYIGMFRPEATSAPRWIGNLKQYKFGVDLANPLKPKLFLADSTGAAAIATNNSGFISPNAVSYWNAPKNTSVLPDSLGGFWVNNPSGTPSTGFDTPDGAAVEKGGAGFRLRMDNLQDDYTANPSTPRNVYTCAGSGCVATALLSTMPFATSNSNLTATALGITNPTYTQSVSSIWRVSGTNVVTVTMSATPSPAITDPTTVIIKGSASGQFDYSLASASPTTATTTVTYNLPQELPTTPVATPANWTVTGAASGSTSVTSLTRNGTNGLFTATAILTDLTFGGSTTAAVGESVVFANSTGYNTTGTITSVNTGTKTITFTMSETPSVYGGGGKISVGSSTCKTNGQASTHNCDNIGTANTNPPGAQATLPGLVRGTSCSGCTANSGNILMVNFPGGTTELNATVPATGVKAYIQSGALPANYVNATTGFSIVGVGASCSVTETDTSGTVRTYTGTANAAGPKYYTLCLDLGASFVVAPTVAGNGAGASTTVTRLSNFTRIVSSLTRGASACTGSSSSATSNNATATVTTTAAHGFTVGEVVQVASASPGSTETKYVGSATIVTVPTTTTFTYSVATSPACKDTTAGMSITYQSSAGGITTKDLINWVRGEDNIGDEQSPGSTITVRPSVHGDVLHSRPAVINYGSTGVVVFYGSNDGLFHAVNGNQTGNIAGVEPGGELWSFVPSEFFSKLQRMYSNSPSIHLVNTPPGITPYPTQRDYFFDGATGVYQDAASGKVYLYLTAHRGGRIIYAIDVSTPQTPKFMWKFGGCPNLDDNANCPSGAPTELGQTWSLPKAVMVKGNTNPVLIFGAGYYGGYKVNQSTGVGTYFGEDNEPPDTNSLMGRGVFVLDAVTGTQLWKAGPGGSTNTCTGTNCQLLDMKYAVPGDVTLLDRDRPADGIVDRAYVADVGGNIWRIDFEPAGGNAPANWQVTKFAALGGAASDTTKRKFLYGPDVVVTNGFDMVVAGTGDREHPSYSNTVTRGIVNRFYMLKDTRTGKDANVPSAWAPIVDATSSTTDTAVNSSILFHVIPATPTTPATNYPSTFPANGFYVTLPNAGEKFANGPSTIGGNVFFGTNTPTAPQANSCSKGLGDARGYQINIVTGATYSIVLDSGGLPPSPVTGLVNVPKPGGGTITVPFQIGAGGPGPDCTGSDCKSPFAPGPVDPDIGAKRSRLFWYIEKHDTN